MTNVVMKLTSKKYRRGVIMGPRDCEPTSDVVEIGIGSTWKTFSTGNEMNELLVFGETSFLSTDFAFISVSESSSE